MGNENLDSNRLLSLYNYKSILFCIVDNKRVQVFVIRTCIPLISEVCQGNIRYMHITYRANACL